MKEIYVPGNQVELLTSGEAYFPQLLDSLAAAEREIIFETYIFAPDSVGESIKDALVAAARRKLRVYILLDGFGSREFPARWHQELTRAGVRLFWFRPRKGWAFLKRSNVRRLHRKIVTIDGNIAFVGGINILDDWDPWAKTPRYDFCVRMQGPVVSRIRQNQAALWRLLSWLQLKTSVLPSLFASTQKKQGDAAVGFVVRDNIRHRHAIERMYLRAIHGARERIVIANAYFLPGWRFRRALYRAAQRGVEILTLLPARSDHGWVQIASRALYPELLKKGIRIFEYLPSHLHAKVMVVDGHWTTIGSSNIDPLSLLFAQEANVAIQYEPLAKNLEAELIGAMHERSQEIIASSASLGFFNRAHALMLFGLARFALKLFPTGMKVGYWEDR